MRNSLFFIMICWMLLFLVSCGAEDLQANPSALSESAPASTAEPGTNAGVSPETTDLAAETPPEQTTEARSQAEEDEALVQEFLEQQQGAELYTYCHLPSGGVLVSYIDKYSYIYDEINDRYDYDMCFYIIDSEDQALPTKELMPFAAIDDRVYIFYDEDWELRMQGAYDGTTTSYNSCFYWHTGIDGETAIIFVYPNIEWPAFNTGIPKFEYSDSVFFGVEPSDSLGTVPVSLKYEGWNQNYPAWIFVIDQEDMDADYELHYMDYVLTGTELINKSWRIGEAVPIEQALKEWFNN